jgi:hypothetical protein
MATANTRRWRNWVMGQLVSIDIKYPIVTRAKTGVVRLSLTPAGKYKADKYKFYIIFLKLTKKYVTKIALKQLFFY